MLTIALVVFGCAIAVFFSKEFGNSIKKILAIPGMLLLLPLALVSFLLVYFHLYLLWTLTKFQSLLLDFIQSLASLFSYQNLGYAGIMLLVLMSLSFLPVLGLNFWYKRKTFYPFPYAGLTMTLLWLFFAILLVTAY